VVPNNRTWESEDGRRSRVHLVARSLPGVAVGFQRCAISSATIGVRDGLPAAGEVQPWDVVVLDLDALPAGLTPQSLRPTAARAQVLLVSGSLAVAPGWLALAAERIVVIEAAPDERDRGCPAVVTRLLHLAAALDPRVVGYAVLAAQPRWVGVGRLEEAVQAVCAQPWEVRRPSQLAYAAGIPPRELLARCRAAGHKRVEYFITEARLTIRVYLVSRGMRVGLAELVAGIRDPSNLRRQLRRARAGLRGLFGGGATVLAALVSSACNEGADRAAQAATADSARGRGEEVALPVVGALVRRGDLVLTIRATGRVRAERLVSLKAETQGTVAEVLVRPGQRVDSGHVVARFDSRPFDLAVREAEAVLADAAVQYDNLLLGDNPRDTSEQALRRRENFRLRAGLPGAEARLDRARLDREFAVIRAPFSGVVDEVGVVPGQRVGAGDLVARLVDLGSLIVEANALEHDLPLLRVGGTAVVTPSAGGGRRYAGTISAVLPLVDSTTRAGRVLVRVRTGDGVLRPGMYADVELESERLRDRVLVPAAAVIERDGRPLVFRVRSGRAEWVYITPGRSNHSETEISPDSTTGRPGLAVGDTVLTAGHLTLIHDAAVRTTSVSARRF